MNSKIYDCVIFNGEWDLLSLRLTELSDIVEAFIIVESDETFSGLRKTPKFDPKNAAVRSFAPRIRYVLVKDMPAGVGAWEREIWQRNAIVRGLGNAAGDDLILMCDVDELPRKDLVVEANRDKNARLFGFEMSTYYFYMNYKNILGEPKMICAVAARLDQLQKNSPNALRHGIRQGSVRSRVFPKGGWHFSYLMNESMIKRKIKSFSHQELNDPKFLNSINIKRTVETNSDLFNRPGFVWDVVKERDLPETVLKNMPYYKRFFYAKSPLKQRQGIGLMGAARRSR